MYRSSTCIYLSFVLYPSMTMWGRYYAYITVFLIGYEPWLRSDCGSKSVSEFPTASMDNFTCATRIRTHTTATESLDTLVHFNSLYCALKNTHARHCSFLLYASSVQQVLFLAPLSQAWTAHHLWNAIAFRQDCTARRSTRIWTHGSQLNNSK